MANHEVIGDLKRKRAVIKGTLTRIVTFINENELNESNRVKYLAKSEILMQLFDKYRVIQEEIIVKEEGESVEREENEFAEFEDLYHETKVHLEEILGLETRVQSGTVDTVNSNIEQRDGAINNKVNIRLPKMEIERFNGKLEDWLRFHEKFKSIIHENKDLNNLQKFHYLISFLEGEAAETIANINISEVNYNFAWDTLIKRYSHNRRLIEAHLSNMFNAPTIKFQAAKCLRDTFNLFIKNLNALNKLNVKTENNDAFLVYLIGSKLDKDTLKAWEEEISETREMPSFKKMYEFLEKRCNYLDSLEAKGEVTSSVKDKIGVHRTKHIGKSVMSANIQTVCNVCNKSGHKEFKCRSLLNLSIQERRNIIQKKGLCWLCLSSGHPAYKCNFKNCYNCKGKHNLILCNNSKLIENKNRQISSYASITDKQTIDRQEGEQQQTSNVKEKNVALEVHHANHCSFYIKDPNINYYKNISVLLPTALINIKNSSGSYITGRFILDSGSEINLIKKDFADKLGLTLGNELVDIYGIGGNIGSQSSSYFITELSSRITNYKRNLRLNIVPKITGDSFNKNNFKISEFNIPASVSGQLADPDFFENNKEIDGLLGAGVFFEVLGSQRYYLDNGKDEGIYFIYTEFGWIVSGNVKGNSGPQLDRCLISRRVNKLDVAENNMCEKNFVDTLKINSDGRFIVELPLTKDPCILGDSLNGAKVRFYNLERKLLKNPELGEHYYKFIKEYIERGHMELVPIDEISNTPRYYLPHHAVYKDSTTTQYRVVFEAQFKGDNGYSLNDILATGPNLQNDLCDLIISFRIPKYGLTADIAKMFRQIWVTESQTDLQRILWRDSPNDELRHYRLRTVTYGTVTAPFLAMRCLRQIAQGIVETEPDIANIIADKFYMDDLITGSDNISYLIHIKNRVENVLKERGFSLRKWATNAKELISSLEKESEREEQYLVNLNEEGSVKTLGLLWSPASDNFVIKIQKFKGCEITKRTILSDIQGFWDPIGLMIPAIIRAKMFLQELWLLGVDWDDPLDPDLAKKWLSFRESLEILNNLGIPRRVMPVDGEGINYELHGFSDASEKAYGCCVYLCAVMENGNRICRLLCAKGKVAPLQATTLPRLELLGALELTRLMKRINKSLNRKVSLYYWTDSKIVLNWINGNARQWKTYVANRVQEIQELSEVDRWVHIPSKSNPADLVSRGILAHSLSGCKFWWEGPSDISVHIENAQSETWKTTNLDIPEVRKINYSLLSNKVGDEFWKKYSSWNRLLRVTAYIIRFKVNCRENKENRNLKALSVEELTNAKIKIIKVIQNLEFKTEINCLSNKKILPKNSNLKNLSVFMDENEVLRVGGRLNNAEYLSVDQKNPILLPNNNYITRLIIRHLHKENAHVGPQTLLAIIRCEYWPIKAKIIIKSIIRECVICKRAQPKFKSTIMADLPKERLFPGRPFHITGIDFCGPLYIKSGIRRVAKRKVYIAVFVCFSVKAVHLELVTDLSTATFMAAFKRFYSRRGKPSIVFSDNGTNFVGAQKELRKLLTKPGSVVEESTKEGIRWRFNPPNSPHFGGLWEAMVKKVKYHLVRTLGGALLNFEEANTLLVQVEACINSRPLTPLSSHPDDCTVLTPAHFLIGGTLQSIPEVNLKDIQQNKLKRFELVQQLQQRFWKRWSTEYLMLLQQRGKWVTASPNLKVGDLVIVKEDNIMPMMWKLARVTAVHPGPDKVVRVATIRFANGQTLKRPIVKLAPLLEEDERKEEENNVN